MAEINLPSRSALERGLIFSILLSALGYLGFSVWAGWKDVLIPLKTVGLINMVALLSLSLVNYGLRFLRWQLYLRALGHNLPFAPSALIYFSGFALTTTPGKAGELLRGLFLGRYGVPFTRSVAALLSERLADLMAILVISLPGMALYPAIRPLAAILLCGFIGFAVFLEKTPRLIRLEDWLTRHPQGFARPLRHLLNVIREGAPCYRSATLCVALLLSVMAWAAEAFAFFLLLSWIHAPLPLWTAMAIYALSVLIGGISFLPGGLGSTEAMMMALLMGCGLVKAPAVAVTLIIRLTTLWFAVFLGAVVLFAGRSSLSRDQKQRLKA